MRTPADLPNALADTYVIEEMNHYSDWPVISAPLHLAWMFCQNFVRFPPILIIFGRKMAKRLKSCEVYSFSTSLNLRHHCTVLNADVPKDALKEQSDRCLSSVVVYNQYNVSETEMTENQPSSV